MDLSYHKIPKKVTPDRLSDAVVTFTIEDKFSSSYLENLLIGRYNESHPELILNQLKMRVPFVEKEPHHFYANKFFRIVILRNTISFNFVTAYPGWEEYLKWIKAVLSNGEINVRKVSLRYISVYKDIAIFSPEVLDGEIYFKNVQDFAGTELQYRCNVHDFDNQRKVIGEARVILTNSAMFENADWTESKIDITISSSPFQGNLDFSYGLLEKLHRHEKILFYSMLNEAFVDTLNPEYE